MPSDLNAAEIDTAAKRLSGVVARTQLELNARLSISTGANVFFKREDLQVVRSYKIRGAFNLIVQLSDEEKAAGVVAASAGNHAQGVAFACRTMGIKGRIYVPAKTPNQKRERIRVHGGDFVELIPTGRTYDDAWDAAVADVQRTGATMVPPFDDPRTATGQGTIAVEILEQLGGEPDVIVVPVGGGGCIAGITTYLRERSPHTTIIGIEPAGAPSMSAAIEAGGPITLHDIDPFVDGAAVRRIGSLPYEVVAAHNPKLVPQGALSHFFRKRSADEPGEFAMVHVEEGAVCTAMLELYQNDGIIAEPAGALSVAALAGVSIAPGLNVVCLVSGGNNDVSRYGEIVERSLVHQGYKHYFLVDFPQEPGALRRFLDETLGPDDDITLFEYVKRNNRETGAALVGLELGDPKELGPLLDRMNSSRLHCERLEPGSPAYRYLT